MKRNRDIPPDSIDFSLTFSICKKTSDSISKILSYIRPHLRNNENETHRYFLEMILIYLKFEPFINGFNFIQTTTIIDEDILTKVFDHQAELIDSWEKCHASFLPIMMKLKLSPTLRQQIEFLHLLLLKETLSFCIKRNSQDTTKNNHIFIDNQRLSRLIERHQKHIIVESLSHLILSKDIQFPYKKFSMKNPVTYFMSLISHKTTFTINAYNIRGLKFLSDLFFPFKYKNSFLSIISSEEDYHNIDIITEYFQETQRLKAKRRDTPLSPIEFWESSNNTRIIEYIIAFNQDLTTYNLREALFSLTKECTQFKCSLVKSIIILFNASSMLDFSAGWGDRLIGALGSSCLTRYVGVDPNLDLKPGHDAIIQTLLPIRTKEFGVVGDFRIIYEPFQYCELPMNQFYDLIFTSPPFFNFEVYTEQINSGQSIVEFPDFEDWICRFLFVSLKKAWSFLNDYGHMIIHITDISGAKICELMNLYIQSSLIGSSYIGLLASIGSTVDTSRPMWVWQKKPLSEIDNTRVSQAKDLINKLYPRYITKI